MRFATIKEIKDRYRVSTASARKIAGEVGYIMVAGKLLVHHDSLEAWEQENLIHNATRSTINRTTGETHTGVGHRAVAPGDLVDEWWNA